MDRTLIRRSEAGLKSQLFTTGAIALVLAIIGTVLLRLFFKNTPNGGWLLVFITWILFIIAWGMQAFKAWSGWKAIRYEIGEEALVIHAGAGMFGSVQNLYRYESIISIRMVQGYWGKKFGFGDIYLTIPKIDNEVILRDIENPQQQILDLQTSIAKRGGGTQSLIH